MNQKHLQNMYHSNVNVSLIVKNMIQIKNEITIKVGMSVKIQKNIICVENNIFGILLLVVMKMENIYEVLLTIQ